MDDRIAAVIARMEATVDQNPGLPELALAVGLSVSRLSHLFRAEVGVPPGRYFHGLRMQRARILLERTSLTVKEVMARVGIADPSHFARDFRRYHGIAPSQVRRGRGSDDASPGLSPSRFTAAGAGYAASGASSAGGEGLVRPGTGNGYGNAGHAAAPQPDAAEPPPPPADETERIEE
jgi:AraC-like DNA-binding protein